MSRIAEARPRAGQREPVTTIEVEVDGRWDALALSEALIPFHSFLVQHDQERWVVHARVPGGHGEQLQDALEAIEEWRAEQGGARAAPFRVDGLPYQPAQDESPSANQRTTSGNRPNDRRVLSDRR